MEFNGCEFRPELYYDRDYQIWVRREESGLLAIGMTDLSQTIAGNILHVRVRRPGTRRPPGKPVATIESGKWAGPIPNFFDCVIEEANTAVLDQPSLLNSAPYEAWVARVRPVEPVDKVLSMFQTGEAAAKGYAARCAKEDIHCKRAG